MLAAGRSSRVADTLDGRSKLLVEIGGQTVLERNLRWLAESGFRSVWINLHYRAQDVRDIAGDGSRFGLEVRYSEEAELLGTAGAFRALASEWAGTVLVVYGDNVSAFDLGKLLARHWSSGNVATIALFDSTVSANSGIAGGLVLIEGERVVSFTEGARARADSPLVNAGVYALEPQVLQHIPPSAAPDFGRDVFPALLAAGCAVTAHVVGPESYCYGIDTPESLERTLKAFDVVRNVPS